MITSTEEYEEPGYALIALGGKTVPGMFAMVDANVADVLNQWNWHARKEHGCVYAARTIKLQARPNQITKVIRMHRFILGVIDSPVLVDHKNHDGLDNRRCNLRTCTHSQNLQNTRKRSDNTSGFKGVSWDSREATWRATIKINGRNVTIGRFSDAETAARMYDEHAQQVFGEFAYLNFSKPVTS